MSRDMSSKQGQDHRGGRVGCRREKVPEGA